MTGTDGGSHGVSIRTADQEEVFLNDVVSGKAGMTLKKANTFLRIQYRL